MTILFRLLVCSASALIRSRILAGVPTPIPILRSSATHWYVEMLVDLPSLLDKGYRLVKLDMLCEELGDSCVIRLEDS